jgi:branched-chain amino acid transport system substrate-binding protein
VTRLFALLAVIALGIGLSACGSGSGDSSSSSSSSSDSNEPIKIGFAVANTGMMEPYDVPARTAAQFAMDDINRAGGIDGRRLTLTSADTKSKSELSGDAATQVLSDGADVVITSCDYDQGSPAATVAQEQGKLAFSTCAGSIAFGPEGIGPLAFTEATAVASESGAMAEWAYREKGWRTAYVLVDDTGQFFKESGYGFATRFREIGGDVVGEDTFKQGDQSIASQISKIKSLPQKPDAIYIGSIIPGLSSAIKQIRAAGLDMPILSDEDIDGDFWKDAIPGVSDIYFATYASIYGDDPDPKVNELTARYRAKTGKIPESSTFLTGYAMIEAIADAIRGADGSTDGAKLQAQLEQFNRKPLLLDTTFNDRYHITLRRTMRLLQIQNGKTTFVKKWTPEGIALLQD